MLTGRKVPESGWVVFHPRALISSADLALKAAARIWELERCLWVTIAGMKHLDQKQLREERVDFAHSSM